jgi:hypothetical protein
MSYNFTRSLDGFAFLDKTIGTEEHDTDLAGLEVHAHALDAGCEPRTLVGATNIAMHALDQFFGLDIAHAMDTGNAVTVVD